jgi:hypothetical protein
MKKFSKNSMQQELLTRYFQLNEVYEALDSVVMDMTELEGHKEYELVVLRRDMTEEKMQEIANLLEFTGFDTTVLP